MASNTSNTNINDAVSRDIFLKDFQPDVKRWYGGNDEVTESILYRCGNTFDISISHLATKKSYTNSDAMTYGVPYAADMIEIYLQLNWVAVVLILV